MTTTNFQFIECTCGANDHREIKNDFFKKLLRRNVNINLSHKECTCLQKKIDAGETNYITSMIIYPGLIEYLDKKKQEGTLTGWDKERYDYIYCEGEYKTMRKRLNIEISFNKKKEE